MYQLLLLLLLLLFVFQSVLSVPESRRNQPLNGVSFFIFWCTHVSEAFVSLRNRRVQTKDCSAASNITSTRITRSVQCLEPELFPLVRSSSKSRRVEVIINKQREHQGAWRPTSVRRSPRVQILTCAPSRKISRSSSSRCMFEFHPP
jgi:hypothetical protein